MDGFGSTANTGATGDRAMLGQLDELERDVRRIQQAATEITGTAESDDGLIEATVSLHGVLVDLVLDPRIYRDQDADALAADIRAAVNDAGLRAQQEVFRQLKDHLPADAVAGETGLAFEPFLRQLDRMKGGSSR
jgi:DNA-binding protein YbaB